MLTLGIDTSGRAGSIALAQAGEVIADRDLAASGRRHARTLVPEMGELLRGAGLAPRDLQAVAVSIGPGSFTGLRVGVVCAKTFAYATGCRIVAVDTFLAVAAAQADANHVWVIDDALREDLFAGEYVRRGEVWECRTIPHLTPLADWAPIVGDALVAGPAVLKLREQLTGLHLGPDERQLPQARQIALLGQAAAGAGRFDDLWTLEPCYIRRSAAEEKADAKST